MTPRVIILSRDADNLRACIAAIRVNEPGAEILVVDDGVDWFAFADGGTFRCDFDIMAGRKPFVFARNANIGLRAEGCDAILHNDDALLETPGGFSALVKIQREHPEYGLVGAVTNLTGQPLQFRHNIGLRQVPHFAFVSVLIPWATFERFGGLDERYCRDYGVEDRDLCTACERAGLKVGVYDFCYVDHGKLHSSFRGAPTTPRPFTENLALYREKWGDIF